MNKTIFIINGSGGVGKDTFVECVRKAAEKKGYGSVKNFSSVDIIKQIAKDGGWNGGKTEKDRKFLSDLKLLFSEYNDLPFVKMQIKIARFVQSTRDISGIFLFLHIREPEEIARVKEYIQNTYSDIKVFTILVKRDTVKCITTNMADANVNQYNYDITIVNDGDIDALEKLANEFVDDILNNKYPDCDGSHNTYTLKYMASKYVYVPKIIGNKVIIDNIFDTDKATAYAFKHNMNILFKEVYSSIAPEVILKIYKAGYTMDVLCERSVAPDGTELPDKVIYEFTKQEKPKNLCVEIEGDNIKFTDGIVTIIARNNFGYVRSKLLPCSGKNGIKLDSCLDYIYFENTDSVCTVIHEGPNQGEVYQYGKYGNCWVQTGTIKGDK